MKDQGIFFLVIILSVLLTLSLENVWIMLGENWCWSLLGLKGLRVHHHHFQFLLGITVVPWEIKRARLEPQTSRSGAQGINHSARHASTFLFWGHMLLESAGMFARKLLVDYKKQLVTNKCLLGVYLPVKSWTDKQKKNKFGFPGNNIICINIWNLCSELIYCFLTLLSFCNLIGQLCVIPPGCSRHTVSE